MPDPQAMALIERVEQIDGADHIEHPHQHGARPTAQRGEREQRQNGRRQVPIGRGAREPSRQVRRDHARDEKGQSYESEGVQQEQRSQGLRTGFCRGAGQMSRAPMIPHTTSPRSTLMPNTACGAITDARPRRRLDERLIRQRVLATTTSGEVTRVPGQARKPTQASFSRSAVYAVRPHHRSIQRDSPTSNPPVTQVLRMPSGATFSTSTTPVKAAITARFMTPPAKRSSIRSQLLARHARP